MFLLLFIDKRISAKNQPIANLDMCFSEEYVSDEVNTSECDFEDGLCAHEMIVR